MARSAAIAAALLASACVQQAAPVGTDRDAGVAACAEAVAAHVGKPVEAVTAEPSGSASNGDAIVTVRDTAASGAERIHACEVDAGGRVHAILHPGA